MKYAIFTATVLCFAASTGQAQTISSTFDTGAEGWVTGSFDAATKSSNNTVAYDAPTQSIIATDPDNDYNGFFAPAKFTGNLSAYAGGMISFQLADNVGNEEYEAPVALFGTAGTLFAYLPFAPSADLSALTSYSINLVGANFYTGSAGAPGAAATDAQLAAVLADITNFGIGLDFHSGPDNTRLDNVVLSAPSPAAAVPEAATWAMMILGLGLVGFAMRRQKITTRVSYAA